MFCRPTDHHDTQATAERRKRPVNKWKEKKELYGIQVMLNQKELAKEKSVAARKSSTRKYLSPTLSIDQILRIYVTKRKEAGAARIESISRNKNAFCTLNLVFPRPKKDIYVLLVLLSITVKARLKT
ncbi:hypothetical protein RRG08_061046 [Elysia crispata]|uniref:Uncharacterized protein n=1 Tax=Elysia crispata TaxID=231223 RepID=A0AAE1AUN2_9GAST|nr:hypothetical protein RRG08_061046 [Elysia crispata]